MPVATPVFTAPYTMLECGCVHPVRHGETTFYCPRHGLELVVAPAA